jgi:hypothetical protein
LHFGCKESTESSKFGCSVDTVHELEQVVVVGGQEITTKVLDLLIYTSTVEANLLNASQILKLSKSRSWGRLLRLGLWHQDLIRTSDLSKRLRAGNRDCAPGGRAVRGVDDSALREQIREKISRARRGELVGQSLAADQQGAPG